MTGPCFVDANVFVYARDARSPAKQARAAQWVAQLWRQRAGRTSIQVLSEYYAVVTRKLAPRVPPSEAWDDVEGLLTWGPQAIDEALLRRSREIERRWRLSWWDSMIVAAAQLQGCAWLLTEDLHDGAVYGGVIARSPFTLSVEEPAKAYVVPEVRSRHRPRGRPPTRQASLAG